MPDFPFIDAHVHLWNPRHFRMPWVEGSELLDQPYELAAYQANTDGIAVEAMVYVEVGVEQVYALLEAQWVASIARQEPRLRGIVAYAPIQDGTCARSYLDALVAIDPRIKGVRCMVQTEPDPETCLQPGYVQGVQLLPEYGLSFDLCISTRIDPRQLSSTIKLVEQCPDTAFMLDHMGKPDIRAHRPDPWRQYMRQLAAFPNVYCKVSGLVTEADEQHWTANDLAPYLEHVLEVFGEDRVAFGGDWPVVLQASSYERWVSTLDHLTAHLPLEAKHKLWHENARRFYRL